MCDNKLKVEDLIWLSELAAFVKLTLFQDAGMLGAFEASVGSNVGILG